MIKTRYKGFTFPYNPHKIQISDGRMTSRIGLPRLGETVQCLGSKCRTIMGEGTFCGSRAAEQCRRLAGYLHDEQPGYLYLPACEPIKAVLTEFTVLCEGDGELISYRFKFEEVLNMLKGGVSGGNTAFLGADY